MSISVVISPCNISLVSRNGQIVPGQPLGHVVVLSAPAPVLVGEPIDDLKVFDAHGGDPTEESLVRELVLELVHSHRHVTRQTRTGVEIPIVLSEEVNIMEDKTVPVRDLTGLHIADVEEHSSVKD